MDDQIKPWNSYSQWKDAEEAWDRQADADARTHPLKGLRVLPQIPGIVPDTARHLKWKSLKYLIRYDRERILPHYFFKKPITYLFRFLRSVFRRKSYIRDGDFFLYGCSSLATFQQLLQQKDSLFVLGFSYCQKPHECPSGRFTPQCIRDFQNPICRQCFIGKALHASTHPQTIPLLIPTIHYIGKKIFEIVDQNPGKKILFLITACELTLEMFGDWGNMVHIQGVGVRLDGRICNTMAAFELSENGIKPGLTLVLPPTQEKILQLIRDRTNAFSERALDASPSQRF